ncbi:MAG: murein biosynthesis integral membrane protein MurJ [Bilophila wadsworthia]
MRLTATHKMGIAALIMAGSVFLSRLMGLVRDKVVSWQFGAGAESDVYFAAFVVPDFLNYLLAGGYISITLIPLLSKRFEEDEADGWRFFSAVFWWAALGIAALTAVAWIFAPELARIVGPGFSPEKQARLAHFLRIILPAQVFFLPGACVSALLYIRKQFLAPALTPLIYNGCIIAGGLLVTGRGMEGFCWGVLFGAALGSFLRLVVAASSGSPARGSRRAAPPHSTCHPLKRLLLLALPSCSACPLWLWMSSSAIFGLWRARGR